jgi:hypothetical protein
MSDYRPDQYEKNYGFKVEFSPGPPSDQTHGKWKTFRGGGLRLHSQCTSRGTDKFKEYSLGTCEWENVVLTGQVTAERKDMLQWYKDMVEKGDTSDCFRSLTLTWSQRDGSDRRTITWNECFLTGYSLTPLDGDADDQECIETVEVCVGYSENFFD